MRAPPWRLAPIWPSCACLRRPCHTGRERAAGIPESRRHTTANRTTGRRHAVEARCAGPLHLTISCHPDCEPTLPRAERGRNQNCSRASGAPAGSGEQGGTIESIPTSHDPLKPARARGVASAPPVARAEELAS